MNAAQHFYARESRREFLKSSGLGIGGLGLGSLLNQNLFANNAASRQPHFRPRAKHVIYLHMVGAPSQLDLFSHKPELTKRNGEKCPDHMFKGKRLAFIRQHPLLLGSRFKFNRHGQGGLALCEHLRNSAQ